jgi:hypothetical protein
MDLLSVTDSEDKRFQIMRRFLARYVLPSIVGDVSSDDVEIDCRTPSDELARPTLSKSNVLQHNTPSII